MKAKKNMKKKVAPINDRPYTAVYGSSWDCTLLGRSTVERFSRLTGADMTGILIGGFVHTRPLTPEEHDALNRAKASIDHTIYWLPDGTRVHFFGFRSESGFEYLVKLAQHYDLAPDQLMKVHIAYQRDRLSREVLERMAADFKKAQCSTEQDSDDNDVELN